MTEGLSDAGPGLRWTPVSDMQANTWVEIPVDEDGPSRWLRVVAVKPPSWTGERRWALSVDAEDDEVWIKVAPGLVFRTSDADTPPG